MRANLTQTLDKSEPEETETAKEQDEEEKEVSRCFAVHLTGKLLIISHS